MNKNLIELKKNFEKIHKMGFVKSMRKGTTGLGYTFECLLGKKEDQDITPDYKGIEIKCKLGYSKTDLNLFTSSPARDREIATNYIFQKYSYHLYGNENLYRLFTRKIYYGTKYELYGYSFKLKIDYINKKLLIQSFYNDIFCENVCYWNFDDLQNHLITKLNYLALVVGYPTVKNGEKYYKYYTIKFYKLKSFEMFLKLIEKGDIYVLIYLREGLNKLGDYKIINNGVSFRIKTSNLYKLFNNIKV